MGYQHTQAPHLREDAQSKEDSEEESLSLSTTFFNVILLINSIPKYRLCKGIERRLVGLTVTERVRKLSTEMFKFKLD